MISVKGGVVPATRIVDTHFDLAALRNEGCGTQEEEIHRHVCEHRGRRVLMRTHLRVQFAA